MFTCASIPGATLTSMYEIALPIRSVRDWAFYYFITGMVYRHASTQQRVIIYLEIMVALRKYVVRISSAYDTVCG